MHTSNPFRYFKTSPEFIGLVVMMHIRSPLFLRNVEDLLHGRGIDISHKTMPYWWNRFEPKFAAEIKQRRIDRMRSMTHWRWHLDDVFVKINGETGYLWRAVDLEGEILESVVSKRRDRKAALKLLRKSLRRHGPAENFVTHKRRSFGAAMRDLVNADRQEMGRYLNNMAENSHLPFRLRERAMTRFRRMRNLQKFAAVHSSDYFNQERHFYSRHHFKLNRAPAVAEWQQLFADLAGRPRRSF